MADEEQRALYAHKYEIDKSLNYEDALSKPGKIKMKTKKKWRRKYVLPKLTLGIKSRGEKTQNVIKKLLHKKHMC